MPPSKLAPLPFRLRESRCCCCCRQEHGERLGEFHCFFGLVPLDFWTLGLMRWDWAVCQRWGGSTFYSRDVSVGGLKWHLDVMQTCGLTWMYMYGTACGQSEQ